MLYVLFPTSAQSWKVLFVIYLEIRNNHDMLLHHAPWKQVRIRNTSVPWISDKIRYKMNRRYKLFKKAINTNRSVPCCGKNTNERGMRLPLPQDKLRLVTSPICLTRLRIRPCIGSCLKKQQILLNRKTISPLKREDDSLALLDEEKAAFIYFHLLVFSHSH